MGKNTLRKFFSVPFVLVTMPLLGLGLAIRYGFDDACDILDKFTEALQDKNHGDN